MSTTSLKQEKSRSKSTTFKLDEENENQTLSDSDRFTKDIVVEDFYVLKDDEYEAFEFETKSSADVVRKVSIMIPEKEKPQQEDFDISQAPQEDEKEKEKVDEAEKKESVSEIDELMKKKEEAPSIDIPDKDFFNKEDKDADKKLVLDKISGITEEVTVDDDEEEEKKETKEEIKEEEVKDTKMETIPEEVGTKKRSLIHFQSPEETTVPEITSVAASVEEDRSISIEQRQDSKESIEPRATLTRRPSGIPDLIKISRKSLLALTGVSARKSEDKSKDADGTTRSSIIDLLGQGAALDPRVSKDGSGKSHRKSAVFGYTDVSPRYRQFSEDDYITGFDLDTDASPRIFLEDFQEEEEEEVKEEEVVHEYLERKPYYERHDKAVQEIAIKKLKYFILQKKLAMYFKRKKMDYATKETDWSCDSQSKFYNKLEAYGELIKYVDFEKGRVTKEIEDTKKQRNEQFAKLTNMFQTLQDREVEIGHGLIFTKTANVIPEKMVERLIRRQLGQMTQVSSMRLTFIRLKDMVQEKLNSIAALDEIAPGFLLADYEQLKTDNRGYADKIEEKDEELTKLRAKCGSTIQVLAHFREKSAALASDLEDLQDDCEEKEEAFFYLRSRINKTKQMRDIVRNTITKIRDDSGLLTQPTLLRDMEDGLINVKDLTDQLNKLMKDYKKRASQIKTIRFRIEQGVEELRRIPCKFKSVKEVKPQGGQLYKGRPSLLMPKIDPKVFDSLSTIKPKLTYDRSQRNSRIKNIKHSKTGKE